MKTARLTAILVAASLGALVASPAQAGKDKDKDKDAIVIRIETDDGQVRISQDGVPLPSGAVVRRDDQVLVLGDDGETVLFSLPHGQDRSVGEHLQAFQALSVGEGLRIGIWLEPVEPALAAHAGVDPQHAILISNVEHGGPADRAGVQRYDLITQVAGERVEGIGDVRQALEEMEEGQKLRLGLRRGGKKLVLQVEPELRELSPFAADWNDHYFQALRSAEPWLRSLDRTVLFGAEEDGDFALISPEGELDMERAMEKARRAYEQTLRQREEALRAVEERLSELEGRLERVEGGRD